MKVFILNLDQSADRLDEQKRQFAQLGMDFERLPAVSVQDISHEFYQSTLTQGQRVMKQTEIACLLSHKKAWEQVIKANEPCAILEDDAVLVRDFATVLNNIHTLDRTDMDFINLEVHGRKKIVGQAVQSLGDYSLLPLFLDKSGTGGYVLYPSGAKKLLQRLSHSIGLADAFIYGCPTLKMYQIEPAVLLQSDKCEQYGVPFDAYPLQSMIGKIQNTHQVELSLAQKAQLKYNRISTQIALGISTLKALMLGKKRFIDVQADRFNKFI